MAKKKGFNNYDSFGKITVFYIINRKGNILTVTIDTEDLDRLVNLGYRWHAAYDARIDGYYIHHSHYVGINKNKRISKTIVLHRLLMNVTDEFCVDHKNHDTLDNRKENLFITSWAKNLQNRSLVNNNSNTGHLNVSYIKSVNQYWVQIMKDGILHKWKFEFNEFNRACLFAEEKRKELFK